MVDTTRRALCAAAASLPLLGARPALAQDFPSRPIRIIVPYPGGDGTDVITRLVALQMQAALNVPVVVDNRTGAAGLLGATSMAASPADGYTLCLMSSGHITHQTLYQRYDLLRQSTPITNIATAPFLFIVPPDSPLRTLQDLQKAMKDKPTQLTMATGGMGSPAHMAWEVFSSEADEPKVNHIPYKSGLESAMAVVARQVDFASTYIGSAYPLVKAGKARALATTSAARLPMLPEVPAVAETLRTGFEYNTLLFYAAPPKTPPVIVQALFAAIQKAAQAREVREMLDALAHQLKLSPSPAAFEAQLKVAVDSELKLIQARGIKPAV